MPNYMETTFEERVLDAVKDLAQHAVREIIEQELYPLIEKVKAMEASNDTYTRQEVLDKLHISETTLWRKCNEGEVHLIKVGKKCFFKKSEIDGLLN